jgi:hypothetical protein
MKTFGKIVTFGLAFAAVASPASAMSNQDFVDNHSDIGETVAVQMALRTEALRSAQTDQSRANCITNNFVTIVDNIPANSTVLMNAIYDPNTRNDKIQTEDIILSAINQTCGNDALIRKNQDSENRPAGVLTAKDYFATIKIVHDRSIVLMLPAATLASRLQSTNPTYAQCIRTNFTIAQDVTQAPDGYSDLYRKLIDIKMAGSDEPVEQTILEAITNTCGPHSK